MMLVQQFKTSAGAQKRAAFENAHSKTHNFTLVRCDLSGKPDTGEWTREAAAAGAYVWRLNKEKRA